MDAVVVTCSEARHDNIGQVVDTLCNSTRIDGSSCGCKRPLEEPEGFVIHLNGPLLLSIIGPWRTGLKGNGVTCKIPHMLL